MSPLLSEYQFGLNTMQKLTDAGDRFITELSNRYNLSRDAVIHMTIAVNNGGCSMAQFDCPELGGSGQWMQGGMTMVGDMFNHGLKATVDNLCFFQSFRPERLAAINGGQSNTEIQ